MHCFLEHVILVLFCECVLEKGKIKVLLPIANIFERYGHLSIIFYKNVIFYISIKKPFLFPKKKKERKNAQTAKCYKIFRKSIFLLISRAHVMMSSVLQNQQKKVMTPFRLTSFSYLFFLINCKIMMRSICKLNLKATVSVNKILETGVLIILSPIFRDIENSGLYRIKTLFLSICKLFFRVLLNHCHQFHLLFLLSGFSFTNIHDSQDNWGIERLLLKLLSVTSIHFSETQILAG